MKLIKLLKNVEYRLMSGDIDTQVTGVNVDSRLVKSGDIYVAIRGFHVDGHDYAKEALSRGAVAVIACEGFSGADGAEAVICVPDTRIALSAIVNNFYGNPSKKFNLVGVTGTNGKTSVSVIIDHILRFMGRKTGLITTIETYCGGEAVPMRKTTPTTPDCVELGEMMSLMEKNGVDDMVMEVSSMGLKTHRVDACHFDVGVFTNISPEHLDDHGSMEDYVGSKLLLFKMANGAVVNVDDDFSGQVTEMCEGKETIRYGIMNKDDCDLYADRINFSDKEVSFDIIYRRKEGAGREVGVHDVQGHLPAISKISISLNIPGQFAVYNLLAAVGACLLLGFELNSMEHALADEIDIPGRYEQLKSGGVTAIIDYAHTPMALENLLETVSRNKAYNGIICVFGCGGDRDDGRRAPMGEISGRLSDVTIITSDNPRTEDPRKIIADIEAGARSSGGKYKIEQDREKAITMALKAAKPGMAVVIAGKGHENYQVLGHETIHFDDREVVREVFHSISNGGKSGNEK